jgi:dihydropteroate synthase
LFNWDNYLDSLETKKIGILNVTKDSFSGDGIYGSQDKLLSKFEIAQKRNFKLLDIGCMSTKPKFKKQMEEMVKVLMEKETIDREEVSRIFNKIKKVQISGSGKNLKLA